MESYNFCVSKAALLSKTAASREPIIAWIRVDLPTPAFPESIAFENMFGRS